MFDPIENLKRVYPLTARDLEEGKTYYMYDAYFRQYRKVFVVSCLTVVDVNTKDKLWLDKHQYFKEV